MIEKKTASQPADHQQTALVSDDFASPLCQRKNGYFCGAKHHCTAHFKGVIFGLIDLDHLHHLILNAKMVSFVGSWRYNVSDYAVRNAVSVLKIFVVVFFWGILSLAYYKARLCD